MYALFLPRKNAGFFNECNTVCLSLFFSLYHQQTKNKKNLSLSVFCSNFLQETLNILLYIMGFMSI